MRVVESLAGRSDAMTLPGLQRGVADRVMRSGSSPLPSVDPATNFTRTLVKSFGGKFTRLAKRPYAPFAALPPLSRTTVRKRICPFADLRLQDEGNQQFVGAGELEAANWTPRR